MIVAIDGPAGVGKSTIAKKIAKRASLFYVNSGSFYRAITLDVIKNGIAMTETDLIIEMTKKIRIGVSDSTYTARDFIDVWKRVERGEKVEAEQRLNFESIETLLQALTPRRWALLKTLRTNGP